jgi:nitrile hydratase
MDWERRIYALVGVLREKRLINTDELRRGIEAIPEDEYESLTYYERWAASLELLLVEKELITPEEIESRSASLKDKWG